MSDEKKTVICDLPEWAPLSDIENIKFYNSVDSLKIIRAALKK